MAFDYWQPLIEGEVYHIYNKSASHHKIFRDNDDYEGFLKKWNKYFACYIDLFGYCLVPNHFHFLIRVRKIDEAAIKSLKGEATKASIRFIEGRATIDDLLVDQFRRYLSAVSLEHKNKYRRKGPLFLPKFKRVMLNNQSRAQHILCYIHHNVIHHNLGKSYQDWPYTSYHQYRSGINSEYTMSLFGSDSEFLQCHVDFSIEYQKDRDLKIDSSE